MPLHFREIKPGIFFDAEDFTITAFPVTHRGPDCLGYVFEGKERRPFLSEKAETTGRPFGPERRDLVAGQAITLSNGERVAPDDVLEPVEKGVKLVIVGDPGKTENLLEVCKDTDALVISPRIWKKKRKWRISFRISLRNRAPSWPFRPRLKTDPDAHFTSLSREDVLKEAQSIHPNVVVARNSIFTK